MYKEVRFIRHETDELTEFDPLYVSEFDPGDPDSHHYQFLLKLARLNAERIDVVLKAAGLKYGDGHAIAIYDDDNIAVACYEHDGIKFREWHGGEVAEQISVFKEEWR